MIKLFYALHEELLKKYAETKTDIIAARNGMSADDVSAAKDDIIRECQVYDFDPENTSNLYSVKNGIATIPIAGMLVQKVDICAAFFGETVTTYNFIREATVKAENDPAVRSIDYDINSGGGVVSGVDETAQIIRAATKPTRAVVRDMAASAAYWLGSATDEIVISSNAAFLGSIGVAVELINRDKADEKSGVQRTVLTNETSKDKRPNMMTEEGQSVLVDELNAIFDVFADSILMKRGKSLSRESIESMGGKVFIAADAVRMGLADGMVTLDDLGKTAAPAENGGDINKEVLAMKSLAEILKENPDAKAEYDEAINAAKAEGADAVKADRERIAKVVKYYGNSEAGVKAITDGKTFADLAADEKVNSFEAAKKATETPVNFGKVTDEGQLPEAVDVNDKEAKQKATDEAVAAYLKGGK